MWHVACMVTDKYLCATYAHIFVNRHGKANTIKHVVVCECLRNTMEVLHFTSEYFFFIIYPNFIKTINGAGKSLVGFISKCE